MTNMTVKDQPIAEDGLAMLSECLSSKSNLQRSILNLVDLLWETRLEVSCTGFVVCTALTNHGNQSSNHCERG